MKLIIPIPYYRHGGVERVIISLINEISEEIDQVVIISSPKIINYFQKKIVSSEKIVYEPFNLPNNLIASKTVGFLEKINILIDKINLSQPLVNNFQEFKNSYKDRLIFQHLIKKYQATHCLYFLINKITPPQINIPISAVIHDVFWHFSPLTYNKNYRQRYDKNLLKWLIKSDKILTVSHKTKSDVLAIFPQFESKIQAIPNAGFIPKNYDDLLTEKPENLNNKKIIFYFPSSFGIYKDHLTLLKASLILSQKYSDFQIVLAGKETDTFIKGQVNLSQQKQTQEYQEYLQEWQRLCQENQILINNHFLGLGFASETELENWYQKSDCVIFPSQYEGFGLGISEAIMRGIPVIASDLDVFKEQIDLYKCPDRITFFEKGNADDLATKMADFIDNPKLKLSGEKLKFYQQLWTWEKVAQKYIKVMSGD
jgi:glycosyltransferase involved in cell wall biosynthesis